MPPPKYCTIDQSEILVTGMYEYSTEHIYQVVIHDNFFFFFKDMYASEEVMMGDWHDSPIDTKKKTS